MLQKTPQKRVLFVRSSKLLGIVVFFVLSLLLGFSFSTRHPVSAATSSTINFQARLMTAAGAVVPDGNYNVEFKIYNAATSTGTPNQGACTMTPGTTADPACLWTETRTSGNTVRVANGYLTANLGSVNAFPSINWNQQLWLSINIGGTGGSPVWDGEMTPRLQLTAVPYAFQAGQLGSTFGSNIATLSFVQPTANMSVLLPAESGTKNVCYQSDTACGFALSAGNTNYIQNGTSLQPSSNFNISGTGIANILQAPTTNTNTIDSISGGGTISIGPANASGGITLGQNTTVASGKTITVQGTALFKPSSDSATVFQVQPSGSTTPVLDVDTSNSRVGIGTSAPTRSLDVAVNNTQTTAPMELLEQAGIGDATLEFKTPAKSFIIGDDASDASKFKISSSTASATTATLGHNVIGGTTDSGSSNVTGCQQFLSGSAGIVTSLSVYESGAVGSSPNNLFQAALYSDNSGSPNTLIVKTASTAIVPNSWNTANVTSTSITASTVYWLCYQTNGLTAPANNLTFDTGTANQYAFFNATTFGTWSSFGPPDGRGTAVHSIYASYAPSGGTFDSFTKALFSLSDTGQAVFQNSSDSITAFQIQNAAGSSNLFNADTLNSRIGIGTAAPSYTLDVGGQINTSVGLSVGGTLYCDTTGCVAKSGSGFYIHNQTGTVSGGTIQAGNFALQGSSTTLPTAVIAANSTGTGDVLDLQNGSGVNMLTVSGTGTVLIKPSSNSATIFQVQPSGSSTPVLDVDTTNSRVGINQATPSRLFDVAQNSTQTTAPMELLEQAGTGDAAIELQNSTISASFYLGQDTNNAGAFTINSSTAAGANVNFVQEAQNSATASATTIAQTFTSNVTTGDLIAVAVGFGSASTSTFTCSDTRGNSYTVTTIKVDATHNRAAGVCYAPNISGGADTVTVTFGATASNRSVVISEYKNLATSSPVDVATGQVVLTGTITANGVTSGNATTTTAGDLIFGTAYDSIGSTSIVAGDGYTQRDFINSSFDAAIQDKIQIGTGSIASTQTFNTADAYIAIMIAFKPASTAITNTFSNPLFTLSQTGAAVFQTSNSTSAAFQIQNNSGAALFTADTNNMYINIGGGNTVQTTSPTLLVLSNKTTGGDPSNGVEGAMYFNVHTHTYRCYANGSWRGCSGGVLFSQTGLPSIQFTGSDTIAGTSGTTTTNAFPEQYTIPGNDCTSGRFYRFTASGTFETATGTNKLTLAIQLGGTTLLTTPAITVPAATSSNLGWIINATFQCYNNNPAASGSINTEGSLTYVSSSLATGVATTIVMPDSNNGASPFVTIDTANASGQVLNLNVTWTSAAVGNVISLHQFTLEASGP